MHKQYIVSFNVCAANLANSKPSAKIFEGQHLVIIEQQGAYHIDIQGAS